MRRTPLLALTVLVPLVPAGITTTAAQAADPPGSSEAAVVRVSSFALESFTPPGGVRMPYGPSSDSAYDLAVSRDGSRTATLGGGEDDIGRGLFLTVRDISGALVRSIRAPYESPREISDPVRFTKPALSPDGRLLAYLLSWPTTSTSSGSVNPPGRSTIGVLDVASGRVRTFPGKGGDPTFLDNNVIYESGRAFRLPSCEPTVPSCAASFLTVRNGPTSGVVIDPTGTRALFQKSFRWLTAPVTITATTVTFGPQRLLEPKVGAAAFDRSGTRIVYKDISTADLRSQSVTGGDDRAYGPPTPQVYEQQIALGVRESTPPVAPLIGPAVLGGTSAQIRVQPDADPTVSRLRVTRTSPGLPTTTQEVPLPTTSFPDTGLQVGRTYTYAVEAVDRSGNVGPASSLSLVATNPPDLRLPVDLVSTTQLIRVADDANPVGTRYTVDVRTTGAWRRLSTLSTEPSVLHEGPPGQTYEVRAASVDVLGNASAPHASAVPLSPSRSSAPAVVPLDQTWLSFGAGAVTRPDPAAYQGSVTLLGGRASATTRVVGDRFTVFGTTCAACGAFDVVVDGVRRARVDTYSAQPARRVLLWSQAFSSGAARTLVIRPVGTPGRPVVVLDALGVRRFTPPSQLRTDQRLYPGQQVVSVNRAYRLVVERNGDLVTYGPGGAVVFRVRAPGSAYLVVESNGNLTLYTAAGRPTWYSTTSTTGKNRMVLKDDGNLVLIRDSDSAVVWTSRTGPLIYGSGTQPYYP